MSDPMNTTNQPLTQASASLTASDPATPQEPVAAPQDPAGQDPGAKPAAEPVAFDPEKLTLPEGFEKNETFTQFAEAAKELGLPQEGAQKLFDMHTAAMKASTEAVYTQWETQNDAWQNEVKNDPEIGGANFEKTRQTVAKLLDNAELTDPKFREAMDFTGAGNHPAVWRSIAKWAAKLTEGGSVAGNPSPTNADGSARGARPDPATSLYGEQGPHVGGPKLS